MNDAETSAAGSQLRRWGPIGAVAVVVLIVVGVLVASGGGDDDGDDGGDDTVAGDDSGDDSTDDDSTGGDDSGDDSGGDDDGDGGDGDDAGGDPLADVFADDVVSWTEAEEAGVTDQIEWGDRCDTERGQVAIPFFFAPDCFAPFEGDNGGETYPGVTADTIKVVWYTYPEVDPVYDYLTGPIANDDTNDEIVATVEGLSELYGSYYETYGRTVEVIRYDATGTNDDLVAARADAETIARDIRPFMVWNTPLVANLAFAETLAAEGVMCACGDR